LARAAGDGGGEFLIFEQTDGVCGERLVVAAFDHQPRYFVLQYVRQSAGLRRHNRQPGGKALGDRAWHVVNVSRGQVNVVSVVKAWHVIERNASGENRIAQFQVARELFEARTLPSVAADGEPGLGITLLDQRECAQHAWHVVNRLVQAAGEK